MLLYIFILYFGSKVDYSHEIYDTMNVVTARIHAFIAHQTMFIPLWLHSVPMLISVWECAYVLTEMANKYVAKGELNYVYVF